ncbi:hypothetical protein GCM10010329_42770 [Streptomyces spiroverticillatus]|uniref:HTH araC/xylS-type domain-containing protein n=1 Tax=Streptomyces finlayi TaxID=67296 RepID=A0A918WZ71_9ACTN|nr:helix-turn-helix domain-containing protein [Streptomyces finlayi]GHA15228.1 hypothetical protein GCM10010329_42770 [Streptomyces spiroverticillatus]GHC96802.1 hypothetical protein GCM10010334_37470 [Streptomyces finlayi]
MTDTDPTRPAPRPSPPRAPTLTPALTHTETLQHTVSELLVPLRVTAPPHLPFHATVTSAGNAALHTARLRSTPHSVLRTPGLISSSDADLFKVTLHLSGTARVEQGDRQRRVRPGDLLALDTTRPYALHLPDPCDVVVLGLPRGLLGPHARALTHRSGEPIPADTGTSALHTLARLRDPDLCAESVAAHHRISVLPQALNFVRAGGTPSLHQLFQGRDRTFTAWLRHERLTRIRRDLADPALSHRTATSIAAAWGFLDSTHLSRALRDEFGSTAAELRRTTNP